MKKFEYYLNEKRGNIRKVAFSNRFQMQKEISTYYWNRASDLNSGALVIWHAYDSPETEVDPKSLGLGEGFSFRFSLHPVFSLLAGFSIELLLKAIAKIIERPHKNTHDLNTLCREVGIGLNKDQTVLLSVLTEAIKWSSRYPTPKEMKEWNFAQEVFEQQKRQKSGRLSEIYHEERIVNLKNYQKIWNLLGKAYWQAKSAIHEP